MNEPLKAPTADGGVLLAPPGGELPARMAQARRRFSEMDFAVAGLPAAELRALARAELAERTGLSPEGPWILTGHQAELHHPGVWFKVPAIAALAEAVGGSAIHVVTDLDTLKDASLAVPEVLPDGELAVRHAAFTDLGALTGGRCPAQLPPPSAEQLERIVARVRQCLPQRGLFDRWADAAGRGRAESPTLAHWIAASSHAVTNSLGVRVADAFFAELIRGQAFARFAAHILLDHATLFRLRAETLADYRRAHGLKGRSRPVADLIERDGALEVPLWLYRPDGPRERLFARSRGATVVLETPSGPVATLPSDPRRATQEVHALIEAGLLLAPRALTLTMFLRSFLGDLFVHGIGGAIYDEVGDELARRWLGWQPPAYITATATLRLDLPTRPATPADLSRARWDLHHARHNPQLYAAGDDDWATRRLLERRRALLAQLEAEARHSPERAQAFVHLHDVDAELCRHYRDGLDALRARIGQVEHDLHHNVQARSREYFFVYQSAERLEGLIDQARRWAAGADVPAVSGPCREGRR